jgi:hypothetical protein
MDEQIPHGHDKFLFKLILGVAGLIILLLIFQLGMFVGFRKANHSFQWGDNYHQVFGGPPGGFLRNFGGQDFVSGHGTTGTIAKIDSNDLIIKSDEGTEITVVVNGDTLIKNGSATIKISDLKVDEQVVIIGSPNPDGSINAEIIRVFNRPVPPPPLY